MGIIEVSDTLNTKKNHDEDLIVQEYFDDILNTITDGIYISDASGKTLKVNKTYEMLTGIKGEEIIGKYVTDLENEGVFNNILNPKIVKTGKAASSVQYNAKGRKVVLSGYPIFNTTGQVVLVVTFARDITVLSQLEDQISFQQGIIKKSQQEVEFLYNKHQKESGKFFNSCDEIMLDMMDLLKRIALTDATALLLGETGVGKGVIARKIHEFSPRNKRPFFKIDCTAIPPSLIESELFGYERGSFSGANAKGKPGLVEMADTGTLFIDEIGELPLAIQGKLLRIIQDQEVLRVGATSVKNVNVRIIAATNRNLEDEVAKGVFRSDLYYRLKVAVINIPALRKRNKDILPLAQFFLEKFNLKYNQRKTFSKDVEHVFLQYKWPGNIRELENLIQSLIITSENNVIGTTNLPSNMYHNTNHAGVAQFPSININTADKSFKEIMNEIEQKLLDDAMQKYGSISAVAKAFKVDRSTIFRKLKKNPEYIAE
ncbi:sigma-54 interaction domain-containing protein [Dehalobacterium formicoaceticum]|uniref:HTH-type transcriptional regulatory protein TyrR n=1 Tax=Dehalobacterium formicoaceticum TaxID=51515 RepID=A0ABT1Y223_9FIRM|nr:sigma 54-interacting transcriptional regulator [Dehalobacterium formicoaceticum]MCR6544918.1 sigma 54-interacting transcriptional regulator [Dehalobacterium formicoaceticum]